MALLICIVLTLSIEMGYICEGHIVASKFKLDIDNNLTSTCTWWEITRISKMHCYTMCVHDLRCLFVKISSSKCWASHVGDTLDTTDVDEVAQIGRVYRVYRELPDQDPCPVSYGYTFVLSPRLCYKIMLIFKNWTYHNALCQAEGARLVVLNSQEKQEYIGSLQAQGAVSHVQWVGMQKVSNVFTWQGGSTYVWDWGPNEPDDVRDQNCVYLWTRKLYDIRCRRYWATQNKPTWPPWRNDILVYLE